MDIPDYQQLIIPDPQERNEVITEMGYENKYKFYIKKILTKVPFFLTLTKKTSSLLKIIIGHLESYEQVQNEERGNLRDRILLINEGAESPHKYGSGYGYEDDIQEFNMVLGYYHQLKTINAGTEVHASEAKIFYIIQ